MKPKMEKQGPIAKKVVAALRDAIGARVVDLRAYAEGTARAAALHQSVVSADDVAGFEPAHAVYVRVQNEVSVFCEQLTGLRETEEIGELIEHAQDEYVPGGPPMSPLTMSYFTCWAFCDAAVGAARETIGTLVLAIGEPMRMNREFLAIVRVMQASRMGVYVHEGTDARGRTLLRDLLTGNTSPCIVPSGWRGQRGELWLARVFPPPPLPLVGLDTSVVFTTPYVLRDHDEAEWRAYFERTLTYARGDVKKREAMLKYGIDWNEYVFAGYAGHVAEAIFLTGLPDLAQSLPHGRR